MVKPRTHWECSWRDCSSCNRIQTSAPRKVPPIKRAETSRHRLNLNIFYSRPTMAAENKYMRITSAQVRVKTVSATAVQRGAEYQSTMARFLATTLTKCERMGMPIWRNNKTTVTVTPCLGQKTAKGWERKAFQKKNRTNKGKEVKLWHLNIGE